MALFLAGTAAGQTHGEIAPASTAPSTYAIDGNDGKIVVEITFGPKGKVAASRVVRSNAPLYMEVSTIDYIRKHWSMPLFAEQTDFFPIVFHSPSVKWDGDMTPPPNLFPVTDLHRELTTRLTFGPDGWVSDAAVVKSSGDETTDRQIAIWLKAHWHHGAYANQTMDAPFVFVHPAPPAPPAPPKPKAPPAPTEPAAIPAIRVQ